jgi:hypothetical protein
MKHLEVFASFGLKYDSLQKALLRQRLSYRFVIKAKMSLCTIKHHFMKAYRKLEVTIHTFSTSVLDGEE